MTRRGVVYLVGAILLGLSYYPVRRALDNDVLFVGLALVYLVGLRLIGGFWEKRKAPPE